MKRMCWGCACPATCSLDFEVILEHLALYTLRIHPIIPPHPRQKVKSQPSTYRSIIPISLSLYHTHNMSAILTSMRSVHASSSRLAVPLRNTLVVRALSSSRRCSDIQAEIDKRINPREVIEKKRKEFEDKYGDKLKKRVER